MENSLFQYAPTQDPKTSAPNGYVVVLPPDPPDRPFGVIGYKGRVPAGTAKRAGLVLVSAPEQAPEAKPAATADKKIEAKPEPETGAETQKGVQGFPEGTSRRNMFMVPPEALYIAGLDGPADPTDPTDDGRATIPLDPQMVQSAAILGILETVRVVKRNGRIAVAAGRQRTRWAREVNRLNLSETCRKIQVLAVDMSDEDIVALVGAENMCRVPVDIWWKADRAARLRTLGRTNKEVADSLGVSVQAVVDWKNLLEAHPEVIAAARSGKITPTAAITIGRMPREKHPEALAKLLGGVQRIVQAVTAPSSVTADSSLATTPAKAAPTKPEGATTPAKAAPTKSATPPRKAGGRAAAAVTRQLKGQQAGSDTGPGMRVIGKILRKHAKGKAVSLDPVCVLTLRWIRGELADESANSLDPAVTRRIRGLTEAVRLVTEDDGDDEE